MGHLLMKLLMKMTLIFRLGIQNRCKFVLERLLQQRQRLSHYTDGAKVIPGNTSKRSRHSRVLMDCARVVTELSFYEKFECDNPLHVL